MCLCVGISTSHPLSLPSPPLERTSLYSLIEKRYVLTTSHFFHLSISISYPHDSPFRCTHEQRVPATTTTGSATDIINESTATTVPNVVGTNEWYSTSTTAVSDESHVQSFCCLLRWTAGINGATTSAATRPTDCSEQFFGTSTTRCQHQRTIDVRRRAKCRGSCCGSNKFEQHRQ